MKTFFGLLFLLLIFTSCCFGSGKCIGSYNSAQFRLLTASNGQDLVFGASKTYDSEQLKFYSISGSDTVFHRYEVGPDQNGGPDSLLFVDFDYSKKETVYVLLNDSDVDTLTLTYKTFDASPCCPDYFEVRPIRYNKIMLQPTNSGITILTK